MDTSERKAAGTYCIHSTTDGGIDAIAAFWEKQDALKRDKPAWIHGEIRCKNCYKDWAISRTVFKSEKSLKDHHKCKQMVASRAGTRAERLTLSKRKKRAMEARGQVLMEGEPLKHAFVFTHLGDDFRADGKAEHAIEEQMRKAALRFSRLYHIWKSNELDSTLKLGCMQQQWFQFLCTVAKPGLSRKR